MIKFTKRNEAALKDKIRAIFTLIATLVFCIHEILSDDSDLTWIAMKIILVICAFWYIIGRVFTQILFLLLKEIVEDQVEVEEDKVRRQELRDIEQLERSEKRENIQKVKF